MEGPATPAARPQRLDLRTRDGVVDVHLRWPPASGPHPAVVMYMDAFGIRPALMSMAQRLASLGFVVAVPNLYYRHGEFPPFDKTKVFADGPERDRFKGMIASITYGMVMDDTRAVIQALDAHPGVAPDAPMAAVGYCMGGGFALTAAGTFPDRIAAAASFHGGSLATDKKESPHRLAPQIRGRVYVGVAGIDPSFPPDQEGRLTEAFDAAGVRYTLERYEGARHGFAVLEHPVYDRVAAERHWEALSGFLADTRP